MDLPNYSSIIGNNIEKIINNSSYTKILEEAKAMESFANEIMQAQRIANQQLQPSVRQMAKAANQAIESAKIREELIYNSPIKRFLEEQKRFYKKANLELNNIIGDKASVSAEAALTAIRHIQDISYADIYREHNIDIEEKSIEKSDNFDHFLNKLFFYTKNKISDLPKGYISLQGLLNILFQAVILYYSVISAEC